MGFLIYIELTTDTRGTGLSVDFHAVPEEAAKVIRLER